MRSVAIAGIAPVLLLGAQFSLAQSSFEITDDDNDGRIYKGEFYEVFQQADLFDAVDTDANDLVDEEEFGELEVSAVLTEWDADQDGYLRRREFYSGIYDYMDENGDGYLDPHEWDDPTDMGWFGVFDAP
jgi:hypothetical protein